MKIAFLFIISFLAFTGGAQAAVQQINLGTNATLNSGDVAIVSLNGVSSAVTCGSATSSWVCYANMYCGSNVCQTFSGQGPAAEAAAANALNRCNRSVRPGSACDELETIESTCAPAQ